MSKIRKSNLGPGVQRRDGVLVDTNKGSYASQLYEPASVCETLDGYKAIDEDQIARYRREGYLAVENFYSRSEVQGALDAIDNLISGGVPEFDGILLEGRVESHIDELTLEQRAEAVRKIMDFTHFDQRLSAMSEHPLLLDVVERILETEAEMTQEMALLKLPGGREKPWHQDHAYFDYPLDQRIVGVWISLDEANLGNSCMRVLAGAHREGPRLHFIRRDWQICDTEMLDCQCVAVPLQPGGVLFFDSLLPHGTPGNDSNQKRRALQFHFAAANAQMFSKEDRLTIFGAEGKDVSC